MLEITACYLLYCKQGKCILQVFYKIKDFLGLFFISRKGQMKQSQVLKAEWQMSLKIKLPNNAKFR